MKQYIYLLSCLFFPCLISAQNVGIGTSTPHPNARLEISGINKGLLIPRGDAATRTALNSNTAKGLLLYDTVSNDIWIHNGNALPGGWSNLSSGTNYWVQQGALGTEIKNINTGGFWSANPSTVKTNPASFTVPVSGEGTRLMWLPAKSAFRVGTVYDNTSTVLEDESAYFDSDSIGTGSFAAGTNNKALGASSVAMGSQAKADGNGAVAIGNFVTAAGSGSAVFGQGVSVTGDRSFAAGWNNLVEGDNSAAFGNISYAIANNSFVIGSQSTARGVNSLAAGRGCSTGGFTATALGDGTSAKGSYSIAAGQLTQANGDASTSLGKFTTSRSFASLTLGQYNDSIASSSPAAWVDNDPVLIVGNGTGFSSRSNAVVVYKNGNADLNGYTRLGDIADGAPRIKVKKITGSTPTAQGNFNFYPHGIAQSKILSISGLATVGQFKIIPNHTQAGFQYTLNVDSGNIAVGSVAGNSGSILNAPIIILITYEE